MQAMTPNQPYLLKAFFDWIVDNQLTPYMVVNADFPDVTIPQQFVNDGQIVLNVSPSACVNFTIDTEMVNFQARFSGKPMLVSFPCAAVGAIYARENGAGTVFTDPEVVMDENIDITVPESPEEKKQSPNLSLATSTTSSPADNTKSDDTPEDDDPNDPKGSKQAKKKPGLRIVK
ncbi:ClpXP protease specificity-enhancing factor [Aestuariibacter sp. P117]|uniref:ClpXP protease specificity-enhancing factor n=1 Tax=Glaciecola petra TaxID=3075602 RepID=A0ABU2ZVA3_9ALTE|nr:ClpXP protease specificity-enhancing factor [Aestuariibacter sp. P117]MDT0596577.1 ClpXP protease specificity-enhancing factor [Aestuariibacter sp. P117]